MSDSVLPDLIDELWERRAELSPADTEARSAVVAAVDAVDAGQARRAGADDYVVKTMDYAYVVDAVQKIMGNIDEFSSDEKK